MGKMKQVHMEVCDEVDALMDRLAEIRRTIAQYGPVVPPEVAQGLDAAAEALEQAFNAVVY